MTELVLESTVMLTPLLDDTILHPTYLQMSRPDCGNSRPAYGIKMIWKGI
jgi:hypothetical protein